MLRRSYRLRLKTFSENQSISDSNSLQLYFKGETGLTQTIRIPLKKLLEEIYEKSIQLIDVGNISLVHLKLDADGIQWKFDWIELERDDQMILNFPINRWLDSKLDVLIKEGPVQLAPIYTIIVHTGSISSCQQAQIHLALIGDGASTLPLDLNSNSSLISCTTKDLFRSSSIDRFFLSSLECIDVGRLFYLQFWCTSEDKLAYFCESVEVVNHVKEEKYFFMVNHWFGPNLEQLVTVPVFNPHQDSNIYAISIKTGDVSDSIGEKMIGIHLDFANGKSHEDVLRLSETHQIAFEKDQIDFFLISINNIDDSEIVNVKICLMKKSIESNKPIQWQGLWIEIRDLIHQRNSYYLPPKKLISVNDTEPFVYTSLERIIDRPGHEKMRFSTQYDEVKQSFNEAY